MRMNNADKKWLDRVRHEVHMSGELLTLRQLLDRTGSKALIEVDGGVNLETGRQLKAAGADVLVAGSYIFSAPDPAKACEALSAL